MLWVTKGCKVYQDIIRYSDACMTKEQTELLRVDRWLWYTRFFKSRSLASAAVTGGHVKVNGQRARPGSRVRPGDTVQIKRYQQRCDVEVLSLPARRGSAPEAAENYAETGESRLRREAAREQIRADRRQMPVTDGKPDKRTRRKLRTHNRGQV